jgi:hypothetical protein
MVLAKIEERHVRFDFEHRLNSSEEF